MECAVVFSGGVGIVPWMFSGGAEIVKAISQVMREYDATIRSHHGLFATGPNVETTFGLMHTIEKVAGYYGVAEPQWLLNGALSDWNIQVADIYIKVLSCGR